MEDILYILYTTKTFMYHLVCTLATSILLSDMISPPVQVKRLATGHMEFKPIFRAWVGGHISVNVEAMKAVLHQNVARCRDGESVSKVCLEGSKSWPGCYTITEYTSLFLDIFHQLVSPCSYQWHQRDRPLSLHLYLFLWETFSLPWRLVQHRITNAASYSSYLLKCDGLVDHFEWTAMLAMKSCPGRALQKGVTSFAIVHGISIIPGTPNHQIHTILSYVWTPSLDVYWHNLWNSAPSSVISCWIHWKPVSTTFWSWHTR